MEEYIILKKFIATYRDVLIQASTATEIRDVNKEAQLALGTTLSGLNIADIKWHEMVLTPAKDAPMTMTADNFYKIIAQRDTLIFEQKAEISKLKHSKNKLLAQLRK